MDNRFKVDNRSNPHVEIAVREARMAEAPDDFHAALTALSDRGVPWTVIERIFVYRQRCRVTDSLPQG